MKQAYMGFVAGVIFISVCTIIVTVAAKYYDNKHMEQRAVEVGVADKDRSGRIVWINPDFYYVLTGEPKNVISSGSYMSGEDQPR